MSDVPMLEVIGMHSGYGRVEVVHGVDLALGTGELVAVIGANGAGKSTLLKSVAGLVKPTAGEVRFEGRPITGVASERLVGQGVALVPEGRMLFSSMTVDENLELGAYSLRRQGRDALAHAHERVKALFPVLHDRRNQAAGTLSGGEQQMLAIGRALMSGPRLLLLDEPSLGLAPKIIAEIFKAMDALREQGLTVLLVEQDAQLALRHATRGYVMRTGRVVLEGDATDLLDDEDVRTIYLGARPGSAREGNAS